MHIKKKVIIILIIIISVVIGGYIYWESEKKDTSQLTHNALWEDYEVRNVTIEGTEYRLVVADTPDRWQKGLMFVRKPVRDFDGMIFIFPTYEFKSFWNMNTFENLTLYWMQDDEVVGTSELPSIEESKEIVRVSSPAAVNRVVEIIQ